MPLTEDYLKSVSESELKDRAFTPFELQKYEYESLEEIKKYLKLKKYKDKLQVQEALDFVDKLANKMTIAINNEKKEGKANWELESDLNEVRKIFDQLNNLLQNMGQKELDDSVQESLAPKKKKTMPNKR